MNAPNVHHLDIGPIVPLIVFDDARDAEEVGIILVEAGFRAAEVALRTPASLLAIAAIAQVPGLIVVAGTVVEAAQVSAAVDAGAAAIVSPGFLEDVAGACVHLRVELIPGVATATEVLRARRAGSRRLKFFPAERIGGTGALRAIADPIPDVRFMPSGGIGPHNANAYLAEPSVFAVSGSWFTPRSLIARGDMAGIRDAVASAALLLRGASS